MLNDHGEKVNRCNYLAKDNDTLFMLNKVSPTELLFVELVLASEGKSEKNINF